jgi:hypothetical protein
MCQSSAFQISLSEANGMVALFEVLVIMRQNGHLGRMGPWDLVSANI